MLGFTLVISLGFVSYATRADEIDRTQDEIDKTQDEIDRTQDEIDKTQQEIDATKNKQQKLEQAKAGMEAYLKDLNNQYASIGEQIEDLNLQIKEKEQEIEKTQAELEEAKRVEQQQYKDMKTRIQYMYENSQDNFLTILLEEGSFAAALNKANYAVSIAAYDRQMMENYVAQKEAIEDKEAELQGQKEALDELHASVVKKQEEVSALAKSIEIEVYLRKDWAACERHCRGPGGFGRQKRHSGRSEGAAGGSDCGEEEAGGSPGGGQAGGNQCFSG